MTILLIDGDEIAHKASVVVQDDLDWGGGDISSHADYNEAARLAIELISEWRDAYGCNEVEVVIALSDHENFRKDLLPTYKANRKGPKPIQYQPIRELLNDNYQTFVMPRLEADDVLGILATHPAYLADPDKIICSIDKDMATLPGTWWRKPESAPREISEAEADYNWLLQTLTGDSTDGYKGIPGIGPKKAAGILGDLETPVDILWSRVVDAYASKDLDLDGALTQARMARILRHTDYDFANHEVILWEPPHAL